PPLSTPLPYTTLFRSREALNDLRLAHRVKAAAGEHQVPAVGEELRRPGQPAFRPAASPGDALYLAPIARVESDDAVRLAQVPCTKHDGLRLVKGHSVVLPTGRPALRRPSGRLQK